MIENEELWEPEAPTCIGITNEGLSVKEITKKVEKNVVKERAKEMHINTTCSTLKDFYNEIAQKDKQDKKEIIKLLKKGDMIKLKGFSSPKIVKKIISQSSVCFYGEEYEEYANNCLEEYLSYATHIWRKIGNDYILEYIKENNKWVKIKRR